MVVISYKSILSGIVRCLTWFNHPGMGFKMNRSNTKLGFGIQELSGGGMITYHYNT